MTSFISQECDISKTKCNLTLFRAKERPTHSSLHNKVSDLLLVLSGVWSIPTLWCVKYETWPQNKADVSSHSQANHANYYWVSVMHGSVVQTLRCYPDRSANKDFRRSWKINITCFSHLHKEVDDDRLQMQSGLHLPSGALRERLNDLARCGRKC